MTALGVKFYYYLQNYLSIQVTEMKLYFILNKLIMYTKIFL